MGRHKHNTDIANDFVNMENVTSEFSVGFRNIKIPADSNIN